MFDPQQVKQFKEAFGMIDQDGDGRVTEEDLKTMLSSLGEFSVKAQARFANLKETISLSRICETGSRSAKLMLQVKHPLQAYSLHSLPTPLGIALHLSISLSSYL